MSTAPTRNQPCPCGSGKKYKQCCLPNLEATERLRLSVRRAEGRIVDALFPYVLDRFGKPFFEHAWEDFWGDPDFPEGTEFADIPEFDTMFIPWFLTSFVRDPHDDVAQPHWPDEPIALHWMKTEQPALSDLEREWIVATCASPMSAFAVDSVVSGESVDLRDMLTGRRFHVLEKGASRTLEIGDVHFTRVVTAGGVSVMFGGAPISIPARRQIDVLDFRNRVMRRRKDCTRADLFECDIEIRDMYFRFAHESRNPKLPELRNTDGDPIELITLEYRLSLPVDEAFERLKPLAMLPGEEHIDDVTTDPEGRVTAASVNWVKAGNRQHKDWSNTILGHLKIEPGTLVVDINSSRRADRIAKEIRKRLGDLATLASRTTRDAKEMLAQARTRDDEDDDVELAAQRSPELVEMEAELYRRHMESWIDTRVPALGNKTPRQAARTAAGRERIAALLASFTRPGQSPGELAALVDVRMKLGLT